MRTFNMNQTFFSINQTANFYPDLFYKEDYIPAGNSISMCLSVFWANKERGLNADLMRPVINFPRCKETLTGKFIWNEDDPEWGIDTPAWIQKEYDVDCYDKEDCDEYCRKNYNALFVQGKKGKKCYGYDILDTVCLVVKYNNLTDEYEYVGGCFQDGQHYMLTSAEPDKVYNFDSIETEVRNEMDPVIKAGKMSNYTYRFGQSWVNKFF